jgi:formate-nitrite transporter family protein
MLVGRLAMPEAATSSTEADLVTDLPMTDVGELSPKKASKEILRHEIEEGVDALQRPVVGLFLSGLSAGLDVGFSLLLMAIMKTQMEGVLPEPVAGLLVANMYAVGFIFVVLGRSELFTEQTTLAVLPTLSGRASPRALVRLWVVVYLANLLGAALFAWLSTLIASALGIIAPHAFGAIAHRMTDHSGQAIFLSAIFAGWLMGLLSWLVAAGRDTISQIVLVWLITTSIGFAKLHHVILGTVEVLAGAFAGQGISAADFAHFLVHATLGNIVGGVVFVALLKYGQARPEAQSMGAGPR